MNYYIWKLIISFGVANLINLVYVVTGSSMFASFFIGGLGVFAVMYVFELIEKCKGVSD